jgi:hypothetical protein
MCQKKSVRLSSDEFVFPIIAFPRGDVLRCIIADGGPDGEATIWIDNREFSLAEFGKLLVTYAGWGMRIVFVPEDEIETMHPIEIREPDEES